MKIQQIEAWILTAPDEGRPHWVSHFIVPRANELLVRITTDEGVQGIGIATSYTPIEAVIHAINDGILQDLIGADALAPERIYQGLFSLTWQRRAFERRWSREAIVRISAAMDIAMWDIVGKVSGLPLYRLFGGFRDAVPAYVTCAYYREGKDMGELREEISMLKEQGHRGFKAKAGGESLALDRERMALVREVIGDDNQLMIDINRGWDLDTAIEGAAMLADLKPRWLEEPVRWVDDRRELGMLARTTPIPLSAGESELTSFACRSLLEEQAVRILQFDCTMMGGFTEGRKLAALCELNHIQIAPHHDCFIHAHIVAGSPAGLIVESFTDPERDPLQAELFENPPRIEDGMLHLNSDPGLGLTLSMDAVERYGEKIL
jgi:D-galactarolactone cycloisomerase